MKTNIKIIIGVTIGILISIVSSYCLAETVMNSKDVYYKDNSGLAVNNVQEAIDGTCTKFDNNLTNLKKELLNEMYPVGSIYISYNNTNPSSFFGGEWENYGDGRVLKGISSGEAGKTGGNSEITLEVSNLPPHSHSYDKSSNVTEGHQLTIDEIPSHTHASGGAYGWPIGADGTVHYTFTGWHGSTTEPYGPPVDDRSVGGNGYHSHNISLSNTLTGSVGTATPINIQNPYITVYMWRRTA